VVDVLETPDSYIFRAELPGVGRENINIEVSVNKLRIFGERPIEPEPQIAAYHSCERVHGHFDRKFAIPGIIDTEGAAAKYEDGILEIRLPKAREERNHHIHVVCLG
jgi:HSP20 family protein